MAVGPLQVETAAAGANQLHVQSLPASGKCAFVALHGARMDYIAATALLDRVVFSSNRNGNWQIYVCNLDGSELRRLTTSNANDRYPTWSPDGRQIAFSRSNSGQDERICIMNADGSDVRALTASGGLCADPDFSPDGRRLAYRHKRDEYEQIYIMNTDGTCQRSISDSSSTNEWDPAWSPDGTSMAFVSDRSGGYEVYVMDIEAKATTRLTDDSYRDEHPAWDPAGVLLAYESDRNGISEVMLMRSDGSERRNFSASPYYDGMPRFSGTGRLLAFTSSRGGNYDIWLQELGGLQRAWPVTTHKAADDYADLGSPTVQIERVLIGPDGADRGCNPLWSGADAAVVAFDGKSYRNLIRLGIAAEHLSSLQIEPLEHTGTELVGLQVTANRVTNLRQDEGVGAAPTLWDLATHAAKTVLLYMHADSGRLMAVLVVRADMANAAAVEAGMESVGQIYSASADSCGLRLQGQFVAVYDGRGRKLTVTGAEQVRLTPQGEMQIQR